MLRRMVKRLTRKKESDDVEPQKVAKELNRSPSTSVALERPDDEAEIQQMYEALLETLALPEPKRVELIKKETIDKKWILIQAHSHLLRDKRKRGRDEDTPRFWLDKLYSLQSRDNALEEARSLKVVVQGGHKKWLADFIDGGAFDVMSNIIMTHSASDEVSRAVQGELLECFRGLMNNAAGMSAAHRV